MTTSKVTLVVEHLENGKTAYGYETEDAFSVQDIIYAAANLVVGLLWAATIAEKRPISITDFTAAISNFAIALETAHENRRTFVADQAAGIESEP